MGTMLKKVAARWLQDRSYSIIALNWRDRRAEMDVVACHGSEPLRFIAVKYSQSSKQGSGLEYITSTKLRQMAFAAQPYVAKLGTAVNTPSAPWN